MLRPVAQSAMAFRSVTRTIMRLCVFGLVILAIYFGIEHTLEMALAQAGERGAVLAGWIIAAAVAIYTFLIALPFVPGIEIGVSLMVLKGAAIAPVIYGATFVGLISAFLAGRFMPIRWLTRVFRDLHLKRAWELTSRLDGMPRSRRLALLRKSLPDALAGWAIRWRYVALALVLNLPGNAIIGGGGGLCLIAGVSGIFTFRWTAVTLLLAVAPVPLAVWIFGVGVMTPQAGL